MISFSNTKFGARTLLALGAAAMVCGSAAFAQDADIPGGPLGDISIPQSLTIFGKNDPNTRKATAIVNGEIITGTDVDQRMALILSANQGKIQPDQIQALRLQVLRNLIDETLQIQEAKAQEIDVKDSEIDQAYMKVAVGNFGQNAKAMDGYLIKIGSSPASLKRQIKGELSWQRLLRRNVEPFVNVSDEEVKETIDRLQAAKGTEEYRIGEIFLAATPENQAAVFENAKKIVEQIKAGASFVSMARTYSQASTAVVGGDLGWVRLPQLPGELATAAASLQSGQLMGPIPISGGFSIIVLIDKRQVLTADARDAVLALKQVSIEFPKGISDAEATKKAGEFANAMKSAKGCGAVDAVAASIGAEIVTNDQVKARDLPPQLQDMVLALNVGEVTPPFGSIAEGVRVLMLCGRDDPKVNTGPTVEDVRASMEEDRVNKRAQAYLRDLRRDAVIEYN